MQKINDTIYTCTLANLPPASTMESGQRIWISDSGVMAYDSGSVWTFDPLPARAWADILSIATTQLATGMICRATDLGLHTFIWDGGNWQSLNNAPIKVGSSRTQVTLSGATTTSPQTAYPVTIPANLLGVGGGRIIAEFVSTQTSSANEKRIGIYNPTASWLASDAGITSSGMKSRLTVQFNSTAQVLIARNGGVQSSYPYIGVAPALQSVDTTAAFVANITGLVATSGETLTIYGYDLWIERKAS